MKRLRYVGHYVNSLEAKKWLDIVDSAVREERGQKLLVDLLVALDGMPENALGANELETPDGKVCALGALGKARGMDMSKIDPCEPGEVAAAFGIAEPLVQQIFYMNDEYGSKRWNDAAKQYKHYRDVGAEERWVQMRAWVASQIKAPDRMAKRWITEWAYFWHRRFFRNGGKWRWLMGQLPVLPAMAIDRIIKYFRPIDRPKFKR